MKIVIHCKPGLDHHFYWADAFREGAVKDGHDVIIARDFHPLNTDLAVVWGGHPRVNSVIEAQTAHNKPYMTLERGFYGDRMKYTSIGLNGFNGLADFGDTIDLPTRFEGEVRPWKPGSELIVIIGQISGDASLRGVNLKLWYQEMADQAKKVFGKKFRVVFRSHPLDKSGWHPVGASRIVGDLDKALSRARAVITYSSTTGIDAILAGVPVMAADELSMIYDIAPHIVKDLKKTKEPDRDQFTRNLSYAQWSEEEIRSGEAWQYISRGIR